MKGLPLGLGVNDTTTHKASSYDGSQIGAHWRLKCDTSCPKKLRKARDDSLFVLLGEASECQEKHLAPIDTI